MLGAHARILQRGRMQLIDCFASLMLCRAASLVFWRCVLCCARVGCHPERAHVHDLNLIYSLQSQCDLVYDLALNLSGQTIQQRGMSEHLNSCFF